MTVENGQIKMQRYWQPYTITSLPAAKTRSSPELKSILLDAVKSHLVSDVPVGAFLSGGIDSSTVASMMALPSSQADPNVFDRRSGSRLQRAAVRPAGGRKISAQNTMRRSPTIAWCHCCRSSSGTWMKSSTRLVSAFSSSAELAKSRVKVVLGGDGGDELFAGYDRYVGNRLVDYYCFVPRALAQARLSRRCSACCPTPTAITARRKSYDG